MSFNFPVAFLAQQPVCCRTSLKLPLSLSLSGDTAVFVFSRPTNEYLRKFEDCWSAGSYKYILKKFPVDMDLTLLKRMDATDVLTIACKSDPIAVENMMSGYFKMGVTERAYYGDCKLIEVMQENKVEVELEDEFKPRTTDCIFHTY